MTPAKISFRGARVELEIVRGLDIPPTEIEFVDDNTGLPIDLSGCSFLGEIRKDLLQIGPPVATLALAIVNPPSLGLVSLSCSGANLLLPCGPDLRHPESEYQWSIVLQDSLGFKHQAVVGPVRVAASGL
jgi:hypothetical protein